MIGNRFNRWKILQDQREKMTTETHRNFPLEQNSVCFIWLIFIIVINDISVYTVAQTRSRELISNPTSPSSIPSKQSPSSVNPSFKDSFNLPTSLPLSCNHSGPSHYHFSLGLPPKSFPQIQYILHRAITVMFSESIPDDASFCLTPFKALQLPWLLLELLPEAEGGDLQPLPPILLQSSAWELQSQWTNHGGSIHWPPLSPSAPRHKTLGLMGNVADGRWTPGLLSSEVKKILCSMETFDWVLEDKKKELYKK